MKVYKNEKAKRNVYTTYDQLLGLWGVAVKEIDLSTTYGTTHVISCGKEDKPPLVLFHGVGDNSALMWIFNAKELAEHYQIFAIDTIGGPGKSCPNENYNKDFDATKWLDEIFNSLRLDRAYIAGVSNGSYITQHYAIMRPERVIKIISMSGCVSVKENGSPLKTMLKVFLPEALFPTKNNVIRLIEKLTGENSEVFTKNTIIMEHYTYLLKGFNNMAMSYHKLKYFDEAQLSLIRDKALFLRGDSDPLGDEARVKAILDKYNMNYRFFKGVGHGINHEICKEINNIIIEYFR
jgi:pimeloyl-ACP methyl ester carboxylesterase